MHLWLNPIKNPSFKIIYTATVSGLNRWHPTKFSNGCFVCARFSPKYYGVDSSRRISPMMKTMAATGKATVAAVDAEGTARRCWSKFQKETVFAMYTPFVICLASGNLELETFRHYIGQDVHFLRAFAHAYEMAAEFADDDDAKFGINDLRNAVMEELKMHNSFVREWGLDPAKESIPNYATVKYTDFLLKTASGKVEEGKGLGKIVTPFEKTKIAAYTLGAMTPCMRLYAFLGKELQALLNPDESSHPYKKWIDTYSSEGYEASALKTEELLDKLSAPLTGEELEVIEKLYHHAMELEVDFFSAQPIVQKTIVPLSGLHDPAERRLKIFSDFDLTCTLVDSCAILAELAIVTAPKADQTGAENQLARKSSTELRNTWDFLSRQFSEEYERCMESIFPSEKAEELNHEGLYRALDKLSDFERRANSRVIESGFLGDLNLEDIKRAGERLILQKGCKFFFQKIVKKEELNADVHILSYCWCGDLIRSAFSSGGLDVLNVHSNEMIYEESISTGEIVKKVESPIDKLQAFNDILRNSGSDGKHLTVYIGDSVGDLLCLLEADVGIVIGSSSSLRRIGSQFGVSFVPLFSGVVKKQKKFDGSSSEWKGMSGTLYTVSSWAEIHAFILGTSKHFK